MDGGGGGGWRSLFLLSKDATLRQSFAPSRDEDDAHPERHLKEEEEEERKGEQV
jgi:hypothetical protein